MADLERVVPLSPGGTATPLFCVHAGSGSAYSYLGLARLLGADRPVYGIEAPGFDNDRAPIRSVPALSAEYADVLREFRPDGDFLLLGWSVGGSIAFDLAQRLTAAGSRVRRLVLIDTSVPEVTPLPPEKEIARRFLSDLLAGLGAPLTALDGIVDTTTGDTLLPAVERSAVLPSELDAELLAERYAVFRAHVEASYGFEVTEAYHGPVVHVIASESPSHYMHWGKVATDLTEHFLPGTHHSIWAADNLPHLAGLIRNALADAD